MQHRGYRRFGSGLGACQLRHLPGAQAAGLGKQLAVPEGAAGSASSPQGDAEVDLFGLVQESPRRRWRSPSGDGAAAHAGIDILGRRRVQVGCPWCHVLGRGPHADEGLGRASHTMQRDWSSRCLGVGPGVSVHAQVGDARLVLELVGAGRRARPGRRPAAVPQAQPGLHRRQRPGSFRREGVEPRASPDRTRAALAASDVDGIRRAGACFAYRFR
mmetsp:Transcript_70381/g.183281  ORF Transcript_70381/g.183281 Transcript_70381/m.183281 type:complete len:216 (-) Transcript_70381:19-666(-)